MLRIRIVVAKIPMGRKPALSLSLEEELVQYCIVLYQQYFELRLKDILKTFIWLLNYKL